jgi:hypothetical protein
MLTEKQIEAYKRDGYVRAEGLFTPDEVEEFGSAMNWIIKEWWGEESMGWRGPWRDDYLSEAERKNTKAVFIGNPQFYSAAWGRIIFHERLIGCLQSLIGPAVQWHHTILHGKPPELGTPFPMHQDYPFYPHDGPDFVDCLVQMIHPLTVDVFTSFPEATRPARSNTSQAAIPAPISRQINTILTK